MALSADRNTQSRPSAPPFGRYKLKASTTIYAGALVATDANGLLVPASAATGLTVVGRADEQVVSDGSTAAYCHVSQGTFKWANSSGSAIAQSSVGKPCYVEDDQTVATTASVKILAGIVQEIDADGGIWVATIYGQGSADVSGATLDSVSTATALVPGADTSELTVDGTMAMTLAAGTREGQRKVIRCIAGTNTPAATVTYAGIVNAVAKTTMLFNAAGDWVWLEYHAVGGWHTLADNSITYG